MNVHQDQKNFLEYQVFYVVKFLPKFLQVYVRLEFVVKLQLQQHLFHNLYLVMLFYQFLMMQLKLVI